MASMGWIAIIESHHSVGNEKGKRMQTSIKASMGYGNSIIVYNGTMAIALPL